MREKPCLCSVKSHFRRERGEALFREKRMFILEKGVKEMAIQMEVWGKYACFSRPEMKVERVSYDVMTPSAARGILEAVYWHPGLRWHIDRIHVINPIQFTNIRRNEVKSKNFCTECPFCDAGREQTALYQYGGGYPTAGCNRIAGRTLCDRGPFYHDRTRQRRG